MTPENFCYWLRGALELMACSDQQGLNARQVQTINDHLTLVLEKVTPDRSAPEQITEDLGYPSIADAIEEIAKNPPVCKLPPRLTRFSVRPDCTSTRRFC